MTLFVLFIQPQGIEVRSFADIDLWLGIRCLVSNLTLSYGHVAHDQGLDSDNVMQPKVLWPKKFIASEKY